MASTVVVEGIGSVKISLFSIKCLILWPMMFGSPPVGTTMKTHRIRVHRPIEARRVGFMELLEFIGFVEFIGSLAK